MTPPKKGQATQILQHALELPVNVSFRLGNEMVQNLLERMWKFDQSDTPLEKFDPIKGFYTRPSPPPTFSHSDFALLFGKAVYYCKGYIFHASFRQCLKTTMI